MSEHLDDGVGGRLEQVVRQRLQRGQSPADLALELETRMTPEAAEALLARAMPGVDGVSVASRPRPVEIDNASRIALVGACAWSGLLVAQNLLVISAVLDATKGYGFQGDQGRIFAIILASAIVRAVALPLALWMFIRKRTAFALGLAAALILYSHPLHIFVEPRLDLNVAVNRLGMLLGVSALLSYASAGALAFVWRRSTRQPVDLEISDTFE